MDVPQREHQTAVLPGDGKSHSILLVEDDPDVLAAMAAALLSAGYQVVTAGSGREAFERLQSGFVPGLIVLDLVMPGMDGWQFRFAQMKDDHLAGIPVIVLSAEANLQVRAHQQFGAAAYLQKPVDPGELLAAVGRQFS